VRITTRHPGDERRRLRPCVACATLALAVLPTVAELAFGSDVPAAEWRSYGGGEAEQHYSPLAQIHDGNVAKLGLAWAREIDAATLTSTPLLVDGVLYFTSELARVYAIDARTGAQRWMYDPEVWKVAPRAFRMMFLTHRGLAYRNGLLFVGTPDGRLIALHSRDGRPAWSAQTFPPGSNRQISGAPRVFGDKVIIGHGGADYGGTRGYVTAYYADTGCQAWRFYTVPGNPATGFEGDAMVLAAKTWNGEWWRFGGGGTVWNAITFDAELNRIYIGTGNGQPYDQDVRSPGGGDNLFLASIVALDADSGRYLWHYQVNPGEMWDYKATADLVLAELEIDGVRRKVLMQAPTNGFFYVIDRVTGRLLSAKKIGKVTWAERIDPLSGRPVEHPAARYRDGQTVTIWPGPYGTHNWQAMAFSPRTGLVYIPAMQLPGTYRDLPETNAANFSSRQFFISLGVAMDFPVIDPEDGTGELLAWDPVAQQARWRVAYPYMWNGGVLATAGNLVFHGTANGWFFAYAADSGRELWRFDGGRGITAAPITYLLDGRQYVTVLAGWGAGASYGSDVHHRVGWKYRSSPRRVLTFALDGRAELPPSPPRSTIVLARDVPSLTRDAAKVARGEQLFHTASCALCHGVRGVGAGAAAPDLRESALATDLTSLDRLLRDGLLVQRGMPQFDDLSTDEVVSLYHYIRKVARDATSAAAGGPVGHD